MTAPDFCTDPRCSRYGKPKKYGVCHGRNIREDPALAAEALVLLREKAEDRVAWLTERIEALRMLSAVSQG